MDQDCVHNYRPAQVKPVLLFSVCSQRPLSAFTCARKISACSRAVVSDVLPEAQEPPVPRNMRVAKHGAIRNA